MQIILRFNPRFNTKTVIRTAQRSDLKYANFISMWNYVMESHGFSHSQYIIFIYRFYEADEEKYGEFPFKRGKRFVIGITITRDSFNFYVNGQFFAYFNHRESIDQLAIIKCLEINGAELNITNFEYHNHVSMSLMKCLPSPESKMISTTALGLALQTIME